MKMERHPVPGRTLKQIWGRDDYFIGQKYGCVHYQTAQIPEDDPNLEIVNIHGNGFRLNVEEQRLSDRDTGPVLLQTAQFLFLLTYFQISSSYHWHWCPGQISL